MSWLKRKGQNSTPSPAPTAQPIEPIPMYNPNQANHWQSNNWYQQQQQQQYAPSLQPNYWEQPGYTEQQNQQMYNPNSQQYQQYHNQNSQYGNGAPQGQPNNQMHGNLQYNNSFQSVAFQNNEADSWSNWGWGDEDNSNVQSTQSAQPKEQVNPSNELASNTTNDESWNWSVEESGNQGKEQNYGNDIPAKDQTDLFSKMGKLASVRAGEDLANLDEMGSSFPPLATAKRNKLEMQQLSMDSQMSQESSDDILQTSESDNHLASSSTVSHSPLSGLDNLLHTKEELPLENVSPLHQHIENSEIIQNASSNVNHSTSPFVIPQPSFANSASSLLVSKEDLKHAYKKSSTLRNPSSMSLNQGTRQSMYLQPTNQSVNLETMPDNSEHPDVPISSSGKSFSASNIPPTSIQFQNWQDNNEAPMKDRNQYLETGQLSEASQLNFSTDVEPDMMHLRSNQDDTLPPPGLRRMVPGQIEQQATVGNIENFRRDEPPPGLSRMVLGQNEINPNTQLNPSLMESTASTFEPISPPEGLRRMVPGESSSPENSLRQPIFQSERLADDSDQEFSEIPQLRSATIGADTPPVTSLPPTTPSNLNTSNRSETIGAVDSGEKSKGSSTSPANGRRTVRKMKDKKFDNQRRDYIERQPIESDISSVITGVRNLTVGENSTDGANENIKSEPRRKLSRQDTSESEHEKRGKSPRERKDRRVKGDRRERDHYSPDPSRDRRYDRRKYRDRHYDDDGNYFSDGDRDKPNKDRAPDSKYYSLRKDKEKDRRRRESPREYERDSRRKRETYYHRYDGDSYDNEERSRPSSRSDSMHDSMYRGDRRGDKESRDRRRERPRETKHRRPRDTYNPYVQGYGGYDPYSPYYQQYQYQQYYENLRRTNPQAYAEIYRKYYEQHASRHPPAYGADDRSSVHSGRSSANEDLTKDSFSRPKDQTDSYPIEASSTELGRVTPAKFITAHTKVSIGSGRLIKVLPNYPQDGQLALVELVNLEAYLQADDEFREIVNYPGPLIKDITHKKTVIEYCENKIKNVGSNLDISDPESYVLMWEFLILLLRQNGKVVGTDIAELLLKNRIENLNRPSSVLSNLSNTGDYPLISETSNPPVSEAIIGGSVSILKEEEVTNKFREYLLYGSGQEALEWAMKHGLWGHALFLASKLGKRTYSSVMVRFANGLTINDPLQTLYQLLSGRMPAAVSGVADEKWGDWKPHLAMILSNSSLQPDLNRKAITSLGDTLMIRGSLYAAQFCYLMAEVGFGRYGTENIKIVLLGSNHNKPFFHFATNEAIHMTEIYEYACSLNDTEFALPELQVYKYLLAAKLADRGLLEKSLAYLERIALYIINNPSNVQSSLVNNVCNLADRLKYYDPISAEDEDEQFDGDVDNRLDNSWLKNLRIVLNDIDMGLITHDNYTNNDLTLTDPSQLSLYDPILETIRQDNWSQSQNYSLQYQSGNSQAEWQPEQQSQLDTTEYQQINQQMEGYAYQDQQQYWSNQQQQQWDSGASQTENSNQDQLNHYDSTVTQNEDDGKPQISIPNQSRGKSIFDDEPLPHEKTQKGNATSKIESSTQQKQNSSGWFGGIFSKLALKPKNQMKLPDDKNPSIVWDQEKKSWINLDEDNNASTNEMKPPPRITDVKPVMTKPPLPHQSFPNTVSYNNNSMNVPSQPVIDNLQLHSSPNQVNGPQQGNMFKLQRSRNLKKSYIDVFNPGGAVKAVAPLPNLPEFSSTNPSPQMNFFVPQPVNNPNAPTNFITQGTPVIQPQLDESAQGHK